jgi:hypothetical protein
VVATLQEPLSLPEAPACDIAEPSEDDLLAQTQIPPQGDEPAADRRRRAEGLVAIAHGRRELLEQLRSRFSGRLHQTSDDFEATEALRVVEAALSQIPRPEGLWAWQRREQRRRRRRWLRRSVTG